MFFIRDFYQMASTEAKYAVPEYNNIRYFSSLEELLLASRDPEAISYMVDVTGNDLSNNIIGSSITNALDGGIGQDTLEGRGGDDFLYGGSGADLLIGGDGNDVYNVDDAGDIVVEADNNGIEFVMSSVNYVLPDNVEKLGLGGSGRTVFESFENINGTGNALDNELSGNAGNNYLKGLGGNDTLSDIGGIDTLEGGTGDDKYYVESSKSIIVESADGGYDTAFLIFHVPDFRSFDFSKVKNIEVLHFANLGNGEYFAVDEAEFFLLDDKLNPKKAANLDDFEVKNDTIGLSKGVFSKIAKKGELKKGAFSTGSKAHDKDDRVIYDKKAGDLYYDADGSGSRKAVKFADTDKHLKMTAGDFFVI